MGLRSRRRWTLLLCGLALAACGDNGSLPAACTRGPAAVRAALRRAPRPVRLGGVPLSRCVSEASAAGELQASGGSLVGAAGHLTDAGRRGDVASVLQLGYLIGAARRGAGDERGERSELVRRLEQEAQRLGGHGGAAFRRGRRAGRRNG